MATPVGHSLLGITIARLAGGATEHRTWRWYAYAAVAANAADLDFLPGLLVGDANRFHQMLSHSLFAACVFAAAAATVARPAGMGAVRLGWASGGLYASHLLLDFFTRDLRPPLGLPLFWPLSTSTFISSWTPFPGVVHGNPGTPTPAVFAQLLSWHNLAAIAVEIVALLPPLALVWYFTAARLRTARP